MSQVEKPVTISDLVMATGKSRPTVYRLIASGELPGYRTSRGYIIPRQWFEDWQRGLWTMPEKKDASAESREVQEPIDFMHRRAS